jgi:hypothetical protein
MATDKTLIDQGIEPVAANGSGESGYVAKTTAVAETAEKLLERGFPLVPLRPVYFEKLGARGECNCNYQGTGRNHPQCEKNGGGKHPYGKGWSDAEERKGRPDLFTAETWWELPTLNLGVVTGIEIQPGKYLFILDVDVVNQATGEAKRGRESLAYLEQRLGALPPTVSVVTGSGGLQFYFWTSEPLRNSQGVKKAVLAPDIDTRGEGGYGVAPPSMHKSGKRYRWVDGKAPWEIEVAELPAAWVAAVKALKSSEPAAFKGTAGSAETAASRFSAGTALQIAIGVTKHDAWRWATQNPDELDRMTWMGFASNLLAAVDGHADLLETAREEFHTLSEGYARYSPVETDAVFNEASKYLARGGAPHRWSTMSAVPEQHRGDAINLVEDVRRLWFGRS